MERKRHLSRSASEPPCKRTAGDTKWQMSKRPLEFSTTDELRGMRMSSPNMALYHGAYISYPDHT